jgi:hypothetical protein
LTGIERAETVCRRWNNDKPGWLFFRVVPQEKPLGEARGIHQGEASEFVLQLSPSTRFECRLGGLKGGEIFFRLAAVGSVLGMNGADVIARSTPTNLEGQGDVETLFGQMADLLG